MIKKFLSLILILISVQAFSQGLLISATDFAAELKTNKSLVVIDVNGADVYAKQHIQGAINIPHKELYKAGPIEGQIKPAEELAAIFGKKGVSNTNKIVLYDDGSSKYNSRVWWILKSIGASDVSLLNFNMDQFSAARIPLTTNPTSAKATTFAVGESNYKAISMAEVQNRAEGTVLLDAREKMNLKGVMVRKKVKVTFLELFL